MRAAIGLARAQVGRTGDNPAVGCVLVRDDAVIGQGATGDGGRPHGEEIALDNAIADVAGSTAYVTLEPCAERSSGAPSCSQKLVDAGVLRVVVACDDASVMARGRGAARLQKSGVVVEIGLLAQEAAELYAAYRPRA